MEGVFAEGGGAEAAHLGVEAGVVVGEVHAGGGEQHLLLLLLDAGFAADEGDPFVGVRLGEGLEVVVARGGEEAEDVLALVLGVFEEGDGGEVREVDFVSELGLRSVFVDGDGGRAEDEVDLLPGLLLLGRAYSKGVGAGKGRQPTLVFLVRLRTYPLLSTRSNS
jgi:hypothetical protein